MSSIFYSPSERGFFLVDASSAAPPDAIAVTADRHTELLNLQSDGWSIVPGVDGAPIATPQVPHVVSGDEVREWARTIIWEAYGDEALQASVHRYMTELTVRKLSGQTLTAEQEADFAFLVVIFDWEQDMLDFAQLLIDGGQTEMDGYQTADWPDKPAGMDAFVASC